MISKLGRFRCFGRWNLNVGVSQALWVLLTVMLAHGKWIGEGMTQLLGEDKQNVGLVTYT